MCLCMYIYRQVKAMVTALPLASELATNMQVICANDLLIFQISCLFVNKKLAYLFAVHRMVMPHALTHLVSHSAEG